jgi:nucleotide-binding universal stress UspA family protein
MTTPIVVGVDGTKSGLDAVALAARLARATGDPMLVVSVYPDGSRGVGEASAVHKETSAALDAARRLLESVPAEFRTVGSTSAARGLTEFGEQVDARALVVGSTHRGALGRVLSGSTAERLLHGTACPVAVAPRGYRRRPDSGAPLRALGVAYVDSPEGHEALRVATELAQPSGLPVTVITVIPVSESFFTRHAVAPQVDTLVPDEVSKAYREALDKALARVPAGVPAKGELLEGDIVDELSLAGERGIDLLVCGSRGYGPVRRVLLGTVSAALLREASLPILVVPRSGAGHAHSSDAATSNG